MMASERFANSHLLQSQLICSCPPTFQPETHSPSNPDDKQQTRSENDKASSSFRGVSRKRKLPLDPTDISGCRIVALFAYQAKVTLGDEELCHLERFLITGILHRPKIQISCNLDSRIDYRIDRLIGVHAYNLIWICFTCRKKRSSSAIRASLVVQVYSIPYVYEETAERAFIGDGNLAEIEYELGGSGM